MHVDLDDIGLSRGARALLASLTDPEDPAYLTAMVVEAARIKHRLDKLDQLLSGDESAWLRLLPSTTEADVLVLRVDGALQEARQQATVLRQLLAEIRRHKDGGGAADDDDDLAGL